MEFVDKKLCRHCLRPIAKYPDIRNEQGKVVIKLPYIHYPSRLRICKGTHPIQVATPMTEEDVIDRVLAKYLELVEA